MAHRVKCPTCGRIVAVDPQTAPGQTIVCTACGQRMAAPPGTGGQEPTQQQQENPPADAAAAATAAATRQGPADQPARSGLPWWVVAAGAAAVIVLVVGALVVGLVLGKSRSAARTSTASGVAPDVERNADLLELKSEAEQLAIEGRLEEAHERYRKLQQLTVGRDIKDPLFWDIMERAKVDQDRVYTILLARMDPTTAATTNPAPEAVAIADQTEAGDDEAEADEPSGAGAADAVTADDGDGGEAGVIPDDAAPPPATAEIAPTTAPEPTTKPRRQTRPVVVAEVPEVEGVSDDQIGHALQRGVDYLLAQFKNGQLPREGGMDGARHAGLNALSVYALLTAGQSIRDERLDPNGPYMKELIRKMKAHDLASDPEGRQQPMTYARSMRAAALAVHNRREDHRALKEDVQWLINAAVDGAYSYDDTYARNMGARANRLQLDALGLGEFPDDWRWSAGPVPRQPATFAMDFGTPGIAPGGRHPDVILVDGIHDPRTGRELIPDTRRQLPRYTPPPLPGMRTPPPRTGRPGRTRPPIGGYGPGMRGMPPPIERMDDAAPDDAPMEAPQFFWDNSNSQYGLLGVWSGAEVGIEVPERYWRAVEKHWTGCQLRTGEWGYRKGDKEGYLSMTCGGVASLLVTHDYLDAPLSRGSTGKVPFTKPLGMGLAWLERADNCLNTPNPKTHYLGYDLYGLERVGLATGFKYFGKHDWYRELAAKVVAVQWPNGAWGRSQDGPDTVVDTAFTVLFLSRGRHPIFMNKLRFDQGEAVAGGRPMQGFWTNRPRDVANLTRFASRATERALNWQVVGLDREWQDWLDCPVLYIASHQPPGLTDADYEKLRQFVQAGGMLFTHADAGSQQFNKWAAKLAEKIAPGYGLKPLPEDHPLYEVNYKLRAPRPKLQAVSNGSRLLIVHSPTDVASTWQQRADRAQPNHFQLGVNAFLYAAGKADLRNRLDSPYVPAPATEPTGTVRVARLKHAGNWDPEPGAWPRFGRLMRWATGTAAEPEVVDLEALKPGAAPAAHLTGTDAREFTAAEVGAVKAYVEAGGILLIDACGGSEAFHKSVRDGLLAKAFPDVQPAAIPADHPLLKAGGEAGPSLTMKLRPFAAQKFEAGGGKPPEVRMLEAGKGCVVVSPLDVTTGLLGTKTWGVMGYESSSAEGLVMNLLLWAQAREGENAAPGGDGQ